jgi:hypothetical protein
MYIYSSVFPTTFWSCFKLLGLILRSLIYLELIFVQGEIQGSSFGLLHMDIQFSQQYLLKRLSFPIICFGLLPQKPVHYNSVDIFRGLLFCFIGLYAVFVSITCCFLCYGSEI